MTKPSLLLALLIGAAPVAALAEGPPDFAAGAARVKACADARAAAGRFSGVMRVEKDGRAVLEAAYGLADPEKGVKNSEATRFDTGSMSKMFTAVAVGQLVDAGKLRFDAPVGTYLKGLPPQIAAVTLGQLLSHTGGLGNYFRIDNREKMAAARTAADLLPLAVEGELKFKPGTSWAYSNSGYVLLGAVVETVSGQTYAGYLRAHVLGPAGMTETTLEGVPPGAAVPMTRGGMGGPPDPSAPLHPAPPPPSTWASPAGGAYSTARDMARFAQALRTGGLVATATAEALWTPRWQMQAEGPDDAYGYGFGIMERAGVRMVGHNGGIPGFEADLRFAPEAGWTVSLMANRDPPEVTRLGQEARLILTGQPLPAGACAGVKV